MIGGITQLMARANFAVQPIVDINFISRKSTSNKNRHRFVRPVDEQISNFA